MTKSNPRVFVYLVMLVLGCNSQNRNPELLSYNGRVPSEIFGLSYFEEPFYFEPGDRIPIVVEAEDPDRDPLRIWFAYQPPGFCFDPDGTEGLWEVPEDFEEEAVVFDLVLADDAEPMGLTSVEIFYVNIDGFGFSEDGFDFDTGK